MASQPQFRGPFGPLALAALLACAPATSSPDETSGEADTDTESGSTTDTGEPSECAPIAVEVGDAPGAQSLELLFEREDIPGIADQPTTRGQLLGTLHAFDGRLHLGYGDYSENTGPIPMNAWDPGEGAWVYLGTLATEEVQWFRPFGDYLLVPSTDPDAHQGEGGVYRLPCGGLWDESTTIAGAVHVYDVAIQGDTIYAGTGSLTAEPAQLMASTNLGDTWQEVLRKDSDAEKFSRFYFAGATSTQLFVSGRDHPDPVNSFAWLREGDGEFTPLSDPPGNSLVPIVLGEDMVIAQWSGDPGRGSYLASYRIQGTSFVEDTPWPPGRLVNWGPDADPARMLVLIERDDGSYEVHRTDSLVGTPQWELMLTLDDLPGDGYASMALLLNDLYLGTNNGDLWVVREFASPAGP